jgi:diacylglycerol kinase (ATP)
MTPSDSPPGVVVLNPVSGGGEHAEQVRRRATLLGYSVRETEEDGDAVTFAREAAEEGATVVAAAGGDGTLNEVVRGVAEAGALDRVTVGVIPAGTGNNFARHIGIPSVEEGFDVLEGGEARRLDLGTANDRPFVNSCVAGLTADASAETTPELKNSLGVLAYVLTTLRTARSYEGLPLRVTAWERGHRSDEWTGDAFLVLVGNGRRFSAEGDGQADMEDGRFEVVIVEDVPVADLVGQALLERLFGEDAAHTTRVRATSLEITGLSPEPVSFSLDGEIIESRTLSLDVRAGALRMLVGAGYDPAPEPL